MKPEGRNGRKIRINDAFHLFACRIADVVGKAWTFFFALLVIAVWGVTGPVFHFSDTWQLMINTGTTIVTFLMVFLIQNTQNRDAKAMHLKLDELIHAVDGARNKMLRIENMTDEELAKLKKEFERLSRKPDLTRAGSEASQQKTAVQGQSFGR